MFKYRRDAETATLNDVLRRTKVDREIQNELLYINKIKYDRSKRLAYRQRYAAKEIMNKEEILSIPVIYVYYRYMNDYYKNLLNGYLDNLDNMANVGRYSNHIRSYRSKYVYIDIFRMLEICELFAMYQFLSFDILDYLDGKKYLSGYQDVLSEELVTALLLTDDNKLLVEKLKNMVYETEGLIHFSSTLLRGMIISGQPDSIQMAKDLLETAKLSEGLRSAVIENIDLGSMDTYKCFLRYIRDENLIRFSSVKRAFLTFTGLEYDIEDSNIDMLGNYIIECLLENKLEEYLNSDNALKFYVGLYSMACYEFKDAEDYIFNNYDKLDSYKRSVAIYFMINCEMFVDSKFLTSALNTESNERAKMIILSNMPHMYFSTEDDKKSYVRAYCSALKSVDKKKRYSFFTNDDKKEFYANYTYIDVLRLVDEIDDLYEQAYELFDDYFSKYIYGFEIKEIKHPVVRDTILKAIGSNKSDIRSYAYEKIISLNLKLSYEECILLADFMKSKRSDTRKYISDLLSKTDEVNLLLTLLYLINDKNKNKRNAAIDILVDNEDKLKNHEKYTELLNSIDRNNFDESYYDKISSIMQIEDTEEKAFVEEEIIPINKLSYDRNVIDEFLNYDFSTLISYANEAYEKFLTHKGEEIEILYYDNSRAKIRAAFDFNTIKLLDYSSLESRNYYKNYSFYEDFLYLVDKISVKDIFMYKFILYFVDAYARAIGSEWDNNDAMINYFIKNKYFLDIRKMIYNVDQDVHVKLDNFDIVLDILISYMKEEKKISVFDEINHFLLNIYGYFLVKEQKRLAGNKSPSFFYNNDKPVAIEGEYKFAKTLFSQFPFVSRYMIDKINVFDDYNYLYDIVNNMYVIYDKVLAPFDYDILFKLVEEGVMSKNHLYKILSDTRKLNNRYSSSSYAKEYLSSICREVKNAKASKLKEEMYLECIKYMLDIEIERTEKDTEYSEVLMSCNYFKGADVFMRTLSKMGKMTFVRGYSWGVSGKKESFSNIIANTYVEDSFSQEEFDKLVEKYKISDKKILEACMYNLRFIEYAEKYLNINGLKKAAYYFKAHTNDLISEHDKKIIRRYSDIDFSDFANGHMDLRWFKESYTEIGKENFELLYSAAKYMCDGAKHKRAQYFADAVNGNLKISEVEARINDKRNQDMILSYGLLPLRGNRENAALKRYKVLQNFLKESKQYGAQRRQSEALKVSISMKNLALNFGIDVTRFTWLMEAKLIEKFSKYFSPHEVDEIIIYLDISNPKNPDIVVEKKGKRLKSVPAKYNKNAYVKEIKEIKKEIKDQFIRSKKSLENAMINEDIFTYEELLEISKHPVIRSIMNRILFICDERIGFFHDNKLIDFSGNGYVLTDTSTLRIAHAYDLHANDWILWQKYLLDKNIVQPFKQIFRELYIMTEEEKKYDGYTNRFAGYQISSRKMLGIMKSRGWVVNEYDGFEKINHKSNIRVDLYAYADWYTANDVEQPTIEEVVFCDNKSSKTMDMNSLSPILFSETMRDIDLLVSTAYVGGIDVKTNHSTIDMRKRIIEHNMNLMKIENYSLGDNFITINGQYHNYSMHIGSGIIHIEGKGMLPIFPVHAQQRGQIFLPFVDDDPKTSEIISKIILLARDKEIKDPSILMHLR